MPRAAPHARLVCPSPVVPLGPFPKCYRLLSGPWDLGCLVLLGSHETPPTFLADTRMNHVGMGEPTALPLPLSFRAGRNVVSLGGNLCAGEGADRLGAREALPPGWS